MIGQHSTELHKIYVVLGIYCFKYCYTLIFYSPLLSRKHNTDDIPICHFDAASIAVALLNKQVDGTENPLYFSSSIVHDIIELSRFLTKLSDCDHKFSSIAMATIFTVMEAVEESRLLSQYQAKLPKNIREIAKIDARNTVVTTPGTETSSLDRLSELSTNIDRNHLEDATINHNMVMMGPGFNYNSLDHTLSWMNMTMNLNEGNESDLINSIGCEIKSYPGELSPRLQWGDSILEDVSATTPAFGSSTMSLSSVDMELSSCPELAHYSEV